MMFLGDVRDGLRSFIAAGVRAQTCVTSPPYWGLRDYGHAGQIGLEPTIAEYIANMVEVFRLVREVLADDGTLWLQMGDSYAHASSGGGGGVDVGRDGRKSRPGDKVRGRLAGANTICDGLKPKDLIGQPWRLALALQADGWWLRSEIIWHKRNPMPETVSDRPTRAHETLFLMSNAARYFYNADAIREPVTGGAHARGDGVNPKAKWKTPDGWDTSAGEGGHGSIHRNGREKGRPRQNDSFSAAVSGLVDDRNRRTVWDIPTEAFGDAHFATFPTALVEPCILAGSRVGDTVLDPFMGSGTVAQVAQTLGRKWIGCELNPDYAKMIERRTAQAGMVFA